MKVYRARKEEMFRWTKIKNERDNEAYNKSSGMCIYLIFISIGCIEYRISSSMKKKKVKEHVADKLSIK